MYQHAPAASLPPGVPGDDLEALQRWDGISLDAWPRLKADAASQLNETPDTVAAALPALRAKLNALPMVSRQRLPCLRNASKLRRVAAVHELPQGECPLDVSEACLLRYLRARKFRVDDAFNQMVAAATFERKHPGARVEH